MIMAVIVLPIWTIVGSDYPSLVLYGFYFCAVLELIGLAFVLVHIVKIKRNNL